MDDTHSCVIVGNDIVDKTALELTGTEYELYEIGYWILDAALTYVRNPTCTSSNPTNSNTG
jgi:hypothetical protein